MKRILTILFLSPAFCFAQFVVSSATRIATDTGTANKMSISGDVTIISSSFDMKDWNLILTGSGAMINGSGSLLNLSSLEINGSGISISLKGNWATPYLTLTDGIVKAPQVLGTDLIFTGEGANVDPLALTVDPSGLSYIDGVFISQGTGTRLFPIGNATGYFPSWLANVTDGSDFIGMQVVEKDAGLSPLPEDLTAILTDRYWELVARSGNVPVTTLGLSLNNTDTFFSQLGDKVIVESDVLGGIPNNLFGLEANGAVGSLKDISAGSHIFALGRSKDVTLKIHNIITPNGDGANDFLFIENIDFFSENTVILLDRWGVQQKKWHNFKNFDTNNPSDFDFSKLGVGNFICILELPNRKEKPQMITIIK